MYHHARCIALLLLASSSLIVACGPTFDQEAEAQRLRPLIEEGKARWARPEAMAPYPGGDTPYRVIPPLSEALDNLVFQQWEALPGTEPELFDISGLANLATDPGYGSSIGVSILARPEVAVAWDALVSAKDAEGSDTGEPLQIFDFLGIHSLCALGVRRDLELGNHDRFFLGLAALHRLGDVARAADGTHRNFGAANVLSCRFIGDELGRDVRIKPWTEVDARRLLEALDGALTKLTVTLPPLRYMLWESADNSLRYWNPAVGHSFPERARVPEDLGQFLQDEEQIVLEVQRLLDVPLVTAHTRASYKRDHSEGSPMGKRFWSNVAAYLDVTVYYRSELETLRLALSVSLAGEPATITSSRGNPVRARIDGSFVVAEEDHLNESIAWQVRVPLVTK